MEKNGIFTKILAIAGTMLVWFPILAPIVFSLVSFAQDRRFRFDYLLPAELFPVTLVGGGLLLWTALRVRSRRRLIGGSLALAACVLIGSMVLAIVTGLASGEIEPTVFWEVVGLAAIIIYSIALIGIGAGGILLLIDLFRPAVSPANSI